MPPSPGAAVAGDLERADAAGDGEAALALAHQLWRADPGHPTAFRVLARGHRAAGDLAALTEITTVRASRTQAPAERAALWLDVAHLGEELGAPMEAARAYDLALVEEPGHTGALDARGALAFRLGDWTTADLIYRDLAPDESALGVDELALRRSEIAERLGREGEALALAQEAAAAAPGRRDIWMRVQELATRADELGVAVAAARAVLDLVPLDDDAGLLGTRFALVELYRTAGNPRAAIVELERVVRDHPHHTGALEQLAELYATLGDWASATRYLYHLVPLAPTAGERAARLYRLGEALLVHLGDPERADDAFLRASDLDPGHVPTLRRLLDVYWRADDPASLVDVAAELASRGALDTEAPSSPRAEKLDAVPSTVERAAGPISSRSLAQAVIAAALVGEISLAAKLLHALGEDGPRRIVEALTELDGKTGRMTLPSASTAIAELGRRGLVDLPRMRAAAAETPVGPVLSRAP